MTVKMETKRPTSTKNTTQKVITSLSIVSSPISLRKTLLVDGVGECVSNSL